MKGKKTWLPVGLTCLVVLGAVLLPQSVSRARDVRLLGRVHAEAMEVAGGLPTRPASLQEKLTLLGIWNRDSDAVSYFTQDLMVETEEREDSTESWNEAAAAAVESLVEAGVVPEELGLEPPVVAGGERVLLRSQSSGVSASFLRLWCSYDSFGGSLDLVLDEDTGTVVQLYLSWPGASKLLSSPGALGEAFFKTLDLEAELLEEGKRTAMFLLPACAVQYEVLLERDVLWISSTGMSTAVQESPKAVE